MRYFAKFSSNSTFTATPYEYTNKATAIREIIAIAKGNTNDTAKWTVTDERGYIVAAGYTRNGRNYNTPELIGNPD